MAVMWGHTEAVKLLVAAGANIDAENTKGQTLLHRAAWSGDTKVVKLLLAARANVDAVDNEGWTPLHGAAERGHTEVVKLLLNAGAKISVSNTEGRTALDLARERGHTEIADAIIAEDMIRKEKRIMARRIGYRLNPDLTESIWPYLAFGRTKGRATIKRPVSKKKSVANKKGIAKLKKTARKLGIRVTTKRNGKRVDKPKSVLSKQIAVRKKMIW